MPIQNILQTFTNPLYKYRKYYSLPHNAVAIYQIVEFISEYNIKDSTAAYIPVLKIPMCSGVSLVHTQL